MITYVVGQYILKDPANLQIIHQTLRKLLLIKISWMYTFLLQHAVGLKKNNAELLTSFSIASMHWRDVERLWEHWWNWLEQFTPTLTF